MPNGIEDNRLIVLPVESIYIGVQTLSEESLYARFKVQYHQSVLVAFISIALHGQPCNLTSIRRIGRVSVVSFVLLCDILMRARAYIIKVYIAIGGNSIIDTCLLTACVCNLFVIRIPC